MLCLLMLAAPASPRDGWSFRQREFVIGAWWGPAATAAEMALYRDCGFNVVMAGRYMQMDGYADLERARAELDLAGRFGLGVMFDTYTMNDRPWGGQPGPFDDHPLHHPANLAELRWLHQQIGAHPALVGYMIGDDQGSISERSAACTRFLRETAPDLMPWLCGWISPANLAEHGNPIVDPQIYPTLYEWGLPAEELARRYAAAFAAFGTECRDRNMIFWPMINVAGVAGGPSWCASDSLVRFPAYAALAYGAEGLWYFTYNGGALARPGPHTDPAAAREALTPQYAIAAEINRNLAAWGDQVLGRRCESRFSTAWRGAETWPFPEDTGPGPERAYPPAAGKLIEAMSDDLLVGILTAPGRPPLAMIVDCRVSKGWRDQPTRRVSVTFAGAVRGTTALLPGVRREAAGSTLGLSLDAGEGQLVVLRGEGLDALCTEAAIAAPPPASAPRTLGPAGLTGIQAAKLRLEIFGSNGPPFDDKEITLNGVSLGRVPGGGGDAWRAVVIDLPRAAIAALARENRLDVITRCEDAWKFREAELAVRRADGEWVKSSVDATTHSVAGWAYSEGTTWGADGVAGPILLRFE